MIKTRLPHFQVHRRVWEQMIEHCVKEAPIEACGLLSGKNHKADTLWTMENILYSRDYFEMDVQEIEKAFVAMERSEEELLGIYHSHPTSLPYPSPADIENAFYPDVVYLIVSLAKKHPEVGCFYVREGRAIPIAYQVV